MEGEREEGEGWGGMPHGRCSLFRAVPAGGAILPVVRRARGPPLAPTALRLYVPLQVLSPASLSPLPLCSQPVQEAREAAAAAGVPPCRPFPVMSQAGAAGGDELRCCGAKKACGAESDAPWHDCHTLVGAGRAS